MVLVFVVVILVWVLYLFALCWLVYLFNFGGCALLGGLVVVHCWLCCWLCLCGCLCLRVALISYACYLCCCFGCWFVVCLFSWFGMFSLWCFGRFCFWWFALFVLFCVLDVFGVDSVIWFVVLHYDVLCGLLFRVWLCC